MEKVEEREGELQQRPGVWWEHQSNNRLMLRVHHEASDLETPSPTVSLVGSDGPSPWGTSLFDCPTLGMARSGWLFPPFLAGTGANRWRLAPAHWRHPCRLSFSLTPLSAVELGNLPRYTKRAEVMLWLSSTQVVPRWASVGLPDLLFF